jgi:hypothetical protein
MARGLKGLDKMLRTLNTTKDKTAKKCARAGVSAGLTPLTKAMRAAVNASPASTELKRQARKTIGRSLKKRRGNYSGKAGFGVGKPSKKKNMTAHERYVYGQGGAKLASGVGISATNIHWFVLGTDERQTKSGKATGQIKDLLKGVVPSATMSARGAMLQAARKKCTEVLARETAKLSK